MKWLNFVPLFEKKARMNKKIWIYKLFLIGSLFILLNSCEKDKSEPDPEDTIEYGTVEDIDSNSYKTVKIGNQWWMAENLKVTKYRNGDPIPIISDNAEWKNNTAGAYCNYENVISNGEKFGKLYNWKAVQDNRNLAPSGWHVPSNDEWSTLTDFLSNVGYISDSSGFNAIPSGFRQGNGLYIFRYTNYSNWWSSTYFGDGLVWCRQTDGHNVFDIMQGSKNGFSVRCLRY